MQNKTNLTNEWRQLARLVPTLETQRRAVIHSPPLVRRVQLPAGINLRVTVSVSNPGVLPAFRRSLGSIVLTPAGLQPQVDRPLSIPLPRAEPPSAVGELLPDVSGIPP